MDIYGCTRAFMAAIYPRIVLVTYNPIASLCGKYGRRIKDMHTSPQPGQIHFALKEGHTIVGVEDTTTAMCFHIGTDVIDEQKSE